MVNDLWQDATNPETCPNEDGEYLCWSANHLGYVIAEYNLENGWDKDVTHWQNFPEPPK